MAISVLNSDKVWKQLTSIYMDIRTILEKRLIFFVVNISLAHWIGICAVNPWKQIVVEIQKKKHEGHELSLQI